MNLVNGQIIPAKDCDKILNSLSERILETLAKPALDPKIVMEACNKLSMSFNSTDYVQTLIGLGIPPYFAAEYIRDAKVMLSEEYLQNKMKKELGPDWDTPCKYKPSFYGRNVIEKIKPLGVLFHIAAGNSDGLPFFTVIEGLLSGNINLLKLPVEEDGLTVGILQELFRIEPSLAEYVYVFDYTSKDAEVMRRLVQLADAVVIWGGDTAVKAVREMAEANTKIIEWGHKISFAYVSGAASDEALTGIAYNICKTNQLLCSSCQGIFIDTDTMEEVYGFCHRFLPLLDRISKEYPSGFGIGIESQTGFRLYNESLQSVFNGARVFRGEQSSVIAYADQALTTSIMFRNCWVRMLPRTQIIRTLRPYKNYLQTIALVCDNREADQLSELFWKTGAIKITNGYHMSAIYNGSAHDGEYPLRRYTKTTALEF